MDEDSIATFCAITSATPAQAQQYLRLADSNLEHAVELFFSDPSLGNSASSTGAAHSNRDDPITIDDDDVNDDDVQEVGSRARAGNTYEDDEAMARRLQEEMYGAAGAGGHAGGDEPVRAPIARQAETLVGPDSNWQDDPEEMQAAITEQLLARQRRRAAPGIFNQRQSASIWANENASDPAAHRQALSRATGGASEQTARATLLAELYRPPFDLISQLSFTEARDDGKENEKWILVNVQDPSIFDCQLLNRDIWKDESIRETVKEHFIFLQYQKDDPRGQEYTNYYFNSMRDVDDAYPHIAIIDPRTGEQVKTWSGSPAPKAPEFLSELHEFLDRYSLNMTKKNPVQAKRKERQKDVSEMSEEEMLQMALNNSMGQGSGKARDVDPDSLTKPDSSSTSTSGPEMEDVEPAGTDTNNTPFAQISSTTPHDEPTSTDPKETTRIQFRYSGGRVVRRFLLSDHVRRIYEWLKATPLDDNHRGKTFELVSMGKNLIDALDVTISDAGLRNGTVMIEIIDD